MQASVPGRWSPLGREVDLVRGMNLVRVSPHPEVSVSKDFMAGVPTGARDRLKEG